MRLFRALRRPGDFRSLTIYGPFLGPSGHDQHVRQFIRHLHGEGVRLRLEHMRNWSPVELPSSRQDDWYSQIGTKCRSSSVLHFCMPHQVRRRIGLLNVNFTMFEANRVCDLWVRANRRHDLVVVPTSSSRDAWLRAGHPSDRIAICPLGVDTDRFHPGAELLPLQDDSGRDVSTYRTRFLNVSEYIPRKNLSALVRVWMLATSKSDDAILILKLSTDPAGWLAFRREIVELERALGKSLADAAPTLFLGSYLAESEMPRLFAAATHYWSMSCGEGWDLPMSEAAATGLRLVAPDHSAYREYLDSSIARMIPARQVPAAHSHDASVVDLFASSEWWLPNEDAAVAHIASALGDEGRPALAARERMASRFTWKAAARRLITVLEELHDAHGVVF